MKEKKLEMKLASLDDLFTTQEERDYMKAEKIDDIEISKITDFPNHPFKVLDDEKMDALVESIKERGVLSPAIVRPKEDGTYEMISGHRRKHASKRAGLKTLKCLVKDLTDDEATILMVDSNIQREEILPSEKAFAYKMKLDAIKHQGERLDLEESEQLQGVATSAPLVPKLGERTRDIVAEEGNESREQVRRYIRLTYLVDELLEMVDNKKLGFRTAVELSYLDVDNQYCLYDLIEANEIIPNLAQAVHLKKLQQENNLTEDKIEKIVSLEKPNQREKISLAVNSIKDYFPSNYSSKQMQDKIKELLEQYKLEWQKVKSAKSKIEDLTR